MTVSGSSVKLSMWREPSEGVDPTSGALANTPYAIPYANDSIGRTPGSSADDTEYGDGASAADSVNSISISGTINGGFAFSAGMNEIYRAILGRTANISLASATPAAIAGTVTFDNTSDPNAPTISGTNIDDGLDHGDFVYVYGSLEPEVDGVFKLAASGGVSTGKLTIDPTYGTFVLPPDVTDFTGISVKKMSGPLVNGNDKLSYRLLRYYGEELLEGNQYVSHKAMVSSAFSVTWSGQQSAQYTFGLVGATEDKSAIPTWLDNSGSTGEGKMGTVLAQPPFDVISGVTATVRRIDGGTAFSSPCYNSINLQLNRSVTTISCPGKGAKSEGTVKGSLKGTLSFTSHYDDDAAEIYEAVGNQVPVEVLLPFKAGASAYLLRIPYFKGTSSQSRAKSGNDEVVIANYAGTIGFLLGDVGGTDVNRMIEIWSA